MSPSPDTSPATSSAPAPTPKSTDDSPPPTPPAPESHWLGRLVRHLYFLRVPLLGFILLLVLAWLGGDGPPTITNMMLLASPFHLGVTTFLTGVAAAFFGLFLLVTWKLIPERLDPQGFDVPKLLQGDSALRCLPFLVLALPLIGRLWWKNASDPIDSPDIGYGNGSVAVLLGLAATVGLFLFVEWIRRTVVEWMAEHQPLFMGRLSAKLGPGYIDDTGRLHRGHVLAASMAVALALIYLVGYWTLDPADGTEIWLSTLAYVLGLVVLLVSLLAGATFFFDHFRIPVLLALILFAAFLGWFFPQEHYFMTRDLEDPGPTPAEALAARHRLQTAHPSVLTVVAAAGGGIQASAWTAQVLTGLQEELGPAFTETIHLISGVSGGSVGTYFYLHGFDPDSTTPTEEALQPIRDAAMSSSLEATAWGLAYPDFMRGFFPVISERYDRAWATEQAWLRATRDLHRKAHGPRAGDGDAPDGNLWMSTWMDRARDGRLPGTILNATVVEDGGQVLLSNLDLRALDEADPDVHGYTLHERYDRFVDLPTVSAARLSATFPFVTPNARAARPDGEMAGLWPWHFADGGFFDNFGMVGAVRWLRALPDDALKPFRKIVFVQINAFPELCGGPESSRGPRRDESEVDDVSRAGWLKASLAPIRTLLQVRNSTQASRAQMEIELLEELDRRIHPVVFQAPPRHCDEVDSAPSIPGCERAEQRQAPLSWALAESDKKAVACDWKRLKATGKIEELKKVLRHREAPGEEREDPYGQPADDVPSEEGAAATEGADPS